jgi:hypothetical protein
MAAYGGIEPATVVSLMQLRHKIPFTFDLVSVADVTVGRSILAERAVQRGADITFWLDSDMVFTPDQFFKLHEELEAAPHRGLVSALAVRRDGSGSYTVNWKAGRNKYLPFEELQAKADKYRQEERVAPVDVTGLACTVMWTEVFKKCKPPWFQPKWLKDGNFVGEDAALMKKMQTKGYQPCVDFGVHVGHIGKTMYVPPANEVEGEEENVDNPIDSDAGRTDDPS